MRFIAPLGALGLLAVPAVVALYLARSRGPTVDVASRALWRGPPTDRLAQPAWRRLRGHALLAVQLVLAAVLAAGLVRPGVSSATGLGDTTVVLIDGSPSMTATDVAPSRFAAAVDRARRLAGGLGPGQQMAVVVLGEHPVLLSPLTGDRRQLDAALDRARPAARPGSLAAGASLANTLLRARTGGSVVLLSDGLLAAADPPPSLAAPLRHVLLGHSAANAALEPLVLTGDGEVAIRVENRGPDPVRRAVELRADDHLVDVLEVRVGAGAGAELRWPRLPAGTGVLEARLVPADAFEADDRAWLVPGQRPEHRVLLVTRGNVFLERALALRPHTRVTVAAPEDYGPGAYDLWVFDGFVPAGPLPGPALLVGPPAGSGPGPAGPAVDPGPVLPPDPRDPLLRWVSLRDVHVRTAAAFDPPPGWRISIAAASAPLLAVREAAPPAALLTFDLHQSDLPLRAGFPVLVDNLVAFLAPAPAEGTPLAPGDEIRLGGGATTAVEVLAPDGSRIAVRGPYPAGFTLPPEPGVYTILEAREDGGRSSQLVVQVPGAAVIAPGAAPEVRAAAPSGGGSGPGGTRELWPWAAALALALLLAEWVLYHRGSVAWR